MDHYLQMLFFSSSITLHFLKFVLLLLMLVSLSPYPVLLNCNSLLILDPPFFIGASTELDAVSSLSEIVPDTVVFDDFQKYICCFFFPFFNWVAFIDTPR